MSTLSNEINNVKDKIVKCHTDLKNNLIEKGVEVSDSDKMSDLVEKVGDIRTINAITKIKGYLYEGSHIVTGAMSTCYSTGVANYKNYIIHTFGRETSSNTYSYSYYYDTNTGEINTFNSTQGIWGSRQLKIDDEHYIYVADSSGIYKLTVNMDTKKITSTKISPTNIGNTYYSQILVINNEFYKIRRENTILNVKKMNKETNTYTTLASITVPSIERSLIPCRYKDKIYILISCGIGQNQYKLIEFDINTFKISEKELIFKNSCPMVGNGTTNYAFVCTNDKITILTTVGRLTLDVEENSLHNDAGYFDGYYCEDLKDDKVIYSAQRSSATSIDRILL